MTTEQEQVLFVLWRASIGTPDEQWRVEAYLEAKAARAAKRGN
jgi:hypothetical protein